MGVIMNTVKLFKIVIVSAVCVIFSHSHDIFAAKRKAAAIDVLRASAERRMRPRAEQADRPAEHPAAAMPPAPVPVPVVAPVVPATIPGAPVDDDKKEAPAATGDAASFYNNSGDSKRGVPIVTDRPSTVSQRIRDDAEEIAAYLAFQARSAAASTSSGGAAAAAAAAASSSFSSSSSRSGVPAILTSLPAPTARRPFGAAAAPAPKECVEEGIGSLDDDDNIDTLIEITALDAKVIGTKTVDGTVVEIKETVSFSSKLLMLHSTVFKTTLMGDKEWRTDAQKRYELQNKISEMFAFEKFEHLKMFHTLLQHVAKNPETNPRKFLYDSLVFLNTTCAGIDEQGVSNTEQTTGIIMQKAHKLDIKPIITMCAMWFGAQHIDNPVFKGLIKLYDELSKPSSSEEKVDAAIAPEDLVGKAIKQIKNQAMRSGLILEIGKKYFPKNFFRDDIIRIIITEAMFSVDITRTSVTLKQLHDHCFFPRSCDFSGTDLSNKSVSLQEQADLLWKELSKISTGLNILEQIPYSPLKDTLIEQQVARSFTRDDFDFLYWYNQLSPGLNAPHFGNPITARSRMRGRIDLDADNFVRGGLSKPDFAKIADRAQIQVDVKTAFEKIPEGFRKMVLRREYQRIYRENIDGMDINLITRHINHASGFVNLQHLGLTTLVGIDTMLVLCDEVIHITSLNLDNNNLTKVMIPPLLNLITLSLSENKLVTVIIPPLPSLKIIALDNNALVTVTIPSLPNLAHLHLGDNKLANLTLPSLPKLTDLYLNDNQFSPDVKAALKTQYPFVEFVAEGDKDDEDSDGEGDNEDGEGDDA
jgi:hypothetical protein